MLAVLVIWLYISLLSLAFGCLFFDLIKQKTDRLPLTYLLLLGFVVIAAISEWFSIFYKVGAVINLVLSLVALLIIIFKYQQLKKRILDVFVDLKKQNFLIIAFFGLLIVFFLSQTVTPARIYDTGLYHAQAIRWLEEFGLVPGLGNLHDRLAFNSAWFAPSAFFSFAFLGSGSFHLVNGWLATLLLLFLYGGFARPANGLRNTLTWFKVFLLPFFLIGYGLSLSSPTPDMAVTIFIWLIVMFFMEYRFQNRDGLNFYPLVITLLAIFLVTVKLSSAPILILPLYLIVTDSGRQNLFRHLTLVFFALLPFLIRNIIVSGYLVFPLPGLDLFNFDWKMPQANVVAMSRAIQSWSRIPNLKADQVLDHGFMAWFPTWLSAQTSFNRLLLAGTIGTALFWLSSLPFWFKKTITARNHLIALAPLYLTLTGGLVFWFLTAPDVRFGYGFLATAFILLILPLIEYASKTIRFCGPIILILVMIYSLKFIAVNRSNLAIVANHPVRPTAYDQAVIEQKDGIFSPKVGDQCWYATLPCAPAPDSHIESRGANLDNGFRWHF